MQSQAEISAIQPAYRLTVTDRTSGLHFLVDTGANISVIPVTKTLHKRSKCDDYVLYAANGSVIKTYGVRTLVLDLQ